MRFGRKDNQRGFTVQEMLLVILISMTFLAVSVVGIITYLRSLQLAQLDQAAKEIFLAAQNRAILLRGSQQLENWVVDGGNRMENVDVIPHSTNTTQIDVYYIHSLNAAMEELLPDGTIDPTLWEGDFWITYEPESGSVIDVFFCDENLDVEADGGFPDFYEQWRAAAKAERMDRKPMVGYYGGESAESGSTISLRTPVINIYNEDSLRVEVTYWVPRTMMTERDQVELTVTLAYQGQSVPLDQLDADVDYQYTEEISYLAHTYTWTLDSLTEEGPRFQDLFTAFPTAGITYGEDFTVTAEVDYRGTELKVNGARKSASDNSLFAKGSGGETARIAYLRHLQNLDRAWSGVSEEKTRAVQQGDIQGVAGYRFQPIENAALESYDGGEFSIYDLHAAGSAGAPAGLFGEYSGSAGVPKTLRNIRLVNTKVTADSGPAGALVGHGDYLELDNCQIYWENRSEEATNLRDVLGDSATEIHYQITGSGPAGGLAGVLNHSAVTDCSASSLVKSSGPVGGLVGRGGGIAVAHSYAASYLAGPSAAGLVGDLVGSAEITGSYSVGFIDSGSERAEAAGLCLGRGAPRVSSSYSAMLFTAGAAVTNYPLCQSGNNYTQTYYLDSDRFGFDPQYKAWAKSYGDLTDSAQWNTLFGDGVFEAKRMVQSHPYHLQTTLSLTTFIYPGLRDLDHWGDWGARFQDGSLVYYELYESAQGGGGDLCGFHGGGLSHLSDDRTVVKDGYAVAYRGTDFTSAITVTLDVGYLTEGGTLVNESFSYANGAGGAEGVYAMYEVNDVTDSSGQTEDYYLLPLPDQVVNSDYAARDFYQKITVRDTLDTTGAAQTSYYYNPHFANTVLSADEVTEEELPAKARLLQIEVRTPRHLYHLSRFEPYYSSGNQYRFLQQLDLNYDTYTGYDLFTGSWSQTPIGLNAAAPFRGTYYGNCHRITGVVPAAAADREGAPFQHVGLFGYTTGVLQDLVYQMREGDALSVTQAGSGSENLYVGALAGYNGGTIKNCAAFEVRLEANGYQYSTIYLGGLVGENHGTVQQSAVEGASITAEASMSHAYAGGFVGENTAGGIIDQCYAVGKVSVTQARYGTVYACGFAGRSSATLSRSYAAVYLLTDGEAQRFGFSPDSSTSCVYLNNGNFVYREENYAALYEDFHAQPVTWEALAGQDQSGGEENVQTQAVRALGMHQGAASDWRASYPYPSVVTTKDGANIHYGQWPEPMDLGAMGIYYWEKLAIGTSSSYHISAISVAEGNQVVKSGTLSTAHRDGGIVTEYGYGFFYQTDAQKPGVETQLSSQGIGYSIQRNGTVTRDVPFTTATAEENQAANDALAALMDGQYTFHSYDTWQVDEERGLFVMQSGQAVQGQPPYGIWKLEQGAYSLTVQLNPFFADALSWRDGAGRDTNAPVDLPGTQNNAYAVRSIDQLQFINWNINQRNTTQRMDTWNRANYPYLSYGGNGVLTVRSFCWEQTHDLEGEEGVVYTPIAEVYDHTGDQRGVLFGWFGGTYDGNDYLIADVSIKGQSESSCVGLFGAVYNGTLKNIVLYSEDGTATVEGNNSGSSRWYAIGALAGLAGSSTGSAVVNCTVAGYTIKDTHQSTSAGGWGGTGLGGLIGVSDMSLTGCTAVTDIELNSRDNDNVRVGGLVGSCQGSISSSYAGGTIQVAGGSSTPDNRGIYVGGLVGGIYMKPLTVGGSSATVGASGQQLQNTIQNCYTYVELPAAASNRFLKGLYAVGGSGELNRPGTDDGNADHGWTNYQNNYYLDAVVLKQNNGTLPDRHPTTSHTIKTDRGQVEGMSYQNMADLESPDGLFRKLNAQGAGFSTVTTTSSSGAPLSGRYSFGSDPSLLGRDYPFPTILTQSSDLVAGGKANVHYGDWPLAGIRREQGALPVNLDLFADYSETLKGAVHTEVLSLEGVSGGGRWTIESNRPDIAEAKLLETAGDQRTMSVTGLQMGSAVITVTYTVQGSTYMLDVEVNVTAELRLAVTAPSPVLSFTGETIHTNLELRNQDGDPLEALEQAVTLSDFTVEFDPNYFTQASIAQENGLTLTAVSGLQTGSTQMTVSYHFTYLGNEYRAASSLAWSVAAPEITLKPLVFTFGEETTEQMQTREYTGTGTDEFTVILGGDPLEISELTIVGFQEVSAEYKDLIWVQWAREEDGSPKAGTLAVEAYRPQASGPATAMVEVEFRFQHAGSTHTVWKYLEVQIQKDAPSQGTGEGFP